MSTGRQPGWGQGRGDRSSAPVGPKPSPHSRPRRCSGRAVWRVAAPAAALHACMRCALRTVEEDPCIPESMQVTRKPTNRASCVIGQAAPHLQACSAGGTRARTHTQLGRRTTCQQLYPASDAGAIPQQHPLTPGWCHIYAPDGRRAHHRGWLSHTHEPGNGKSLRASEVHGLHAHIADRWRCHLRVPAACPTSTPD